MLENEFNIKMESDRRDEEIAKELQDGNKSDD